MYLTRRLRIQESVGVIVTHDLRDGRISARNRRQDPALRADIGPVRRRTGFLLSGACCCGARCPMGQRRGRGKGPERGARSLWLDSERRRWCLPRRTSASGIIVATPSRQLSHFDAKAVRPVPRSW